MEGMEGVMDSVAVITALMRASVDWSIVASEVGFDSQA